MTDVKTLDTKEIRARAEAASAGPWHHSRQSLWATVTTEPDGYGEQVLAVTTHRHADEPAATLATAAFCAAARADVPALCDALDAARAAAEVAKALAGDANDERDRLLAERDAARADLASQQVQADALSTRLRLYETACDELRHERDEAERSCDAHVEARAVADHDLRELRAESERLQSALAEALATVAARDASVVYWQNAHQSLLVERDHLRETGRENAKRFAADRDEALAANGALTELVFRANDLAEDLTPSCVVGDGRLTDDVQRRGDALYRDTEAALENPTEAGKAFVERIRADEAAKMGGYIRATTDMADALAVPRGEVKVMVAEHDAKVRADERHLVADRVRDEYPLDVWSSDSDFTSHDIAAFIVNPEPASPPAPSEPDCATCTTCGRPKTATPRGKLCPDCAPSAKHDPLTCHREPCPLCPESLEKPS